MRLIVPAVGILFYFIPVSAQSTADSSATALQEVRVSAFARTRRLDEHPSAISVIGSKELDRYSSASLLPALNTAPGVRMEERSPGSYRLSIRGSSLRSPFGVRNVKIYYNDIPLTDPGGFTYFNQMSLGHVRSIQVLKGPSGSLYGQGTGGALLISSTTGAFQPGVDVGAIAGSYNTLRFSAAAKFGDSGQQHTLRYEQLNSEGYREHSALAKRSVAYDALLRKGKRTSFDVHVLYNKLQYQTPGALTEKEYDGQARNARPGVGPVPGSVQQDAKVIQENMLAGFSVSSRFSNHWQSKGTVYGLYSQMENPSIRNYSSTVDPHFGGRFILSGNYHIHEHRLDWISGTELQQGSARTRVYGNNRGSRDTLQTEDKVLSSNKLLFTQLSWQYKRWTMEAGICASQYQVAIDGTFPQSISMDRVSHMQLSPRVAGLYHISKVSVLYATIARGYSPPTVAELAPSGSKVNYSLLPEYGMNYEMGARGTLGVPGLHYDISAFWFALRNAIVLRKDSAGGDSYINAGGTKQLGLEVKLDYQVARRQQGKWPSLYLWTSYTAYDFTYSTFIQQGNDYSGKRLPGSAAHTIAAGADVQLPARFLVTISYFFSDRIALNDANTGYASAYHLLGLKCSYKQAVGQFAAELCTGLDNLLNQKYSLGNDINAAGGRYFNAALPFNVYAGITLHWLPGSGASY